MAGIKNVSKKLNPRPKAEDENFDSCEDEEPPVVVPVVPRVVPHVVDVARATVQVRPEEVAIAVSARPEVAVGEERVATVESGAGCGLEGLGLHLRRGVAKVTASGNLYLRRPILEPGIRHVAAVVHSEEVRPHNARVRCREVGLREEVTPDRSDASRVASAGERLFDGDTKVDPHLNRRSDPAVGEHVGREVDGRGLDELTLGEDEATRTRRHAGVRKVGASRFDVRP